MLAIQATTNNKQQKRLAADLRGRAGGGGEIADLRTEREPSGRQRDCRFQGPAGGGEIADYRVEREAERF